MLKLKYKLWIDKNGKAFGDGPVALLKGIESTGSLNNAAKQIKMSYSQAYNLIKALENRLGFKLIKSKIGGSGGGGSRLTFEAKKLIKTFENFSKECDEELQKIFSKHFSSYETK